ncbi:MAG: WXG100 family type VII secretion target [Anaerolineaceae bacterium]|nr:WXG100 family type VII secretion target [Anaerolineaceae bacterium]
MSTYSGILKVEKAELAQSGQQIKSAAQGMMGGVSDAQRRINALDTVWSGASNNAFMPNFGGLVRRAQELAEGLVRLGNEVTRIGENYADQDSVPLAFEFSDPGSGLEN